MAAGAAAACAARTLAQTLPIDSNPKRKSWLMREVPADRLLVCESGIRSREDVLRMGAAGVNAFLVGEAFMREADPGAALAALFAIA